MRHAVPVRKCRHMTRCPLYLASNDSSACAISSGMPKLVGSALPRSTARACLRLSTSHHVSAGQHTAKRPFADSHAPLYSPTQYRANEKRRHGPCTQACVVLTQATRSSFSHARALGPVGSAGLGHATQDECGIPHERDRPLNPPTPPTRLQAPHPSWRTSRSRRIRRPRCDRRRRTRLPECVWPTDSRSAAGSIA